MNTIAFFDLSFFAIITLIFILSYYHSQYKINDTSNKLFHTILVALLIINILDTSIWMLDGTTFRHSRSINSFITWITHACNLIPVIIWFAYFDYKIFKDIKVVKKYLKRYLIAEVFVIGLLIYNIKNPIIYYITDSNNFVRGPKYIYIAIITYIVSTLFILHLWKYKNIIHSRVIKVICYFFIFPITAATLQLFNFGISVVWPSLTLVTLAAFLMLERENLMKDSLTQLYSRAFFDKELERKLDDPHPFSVVLIDMDDFKTINDTYGHRAGDEALIIVSAILKSNIKSKDIASRFGGDEFLLLLNDTDPFSSEIVISRLNHELISYNAKKLIPYTISMSAGGIFVDKPTTMNSKDIVHLADKEMYCCKKYKKGL